MCFCSVWGTRLTQRSLIFSRYLATQRAASQSVKSGLEELCEPRKCSKRKNWELWWARGWRQLPRTYSACLNKLLKNMRRKFFVQSRSSSDKEAGRRVKVRAGHAPVKVSPITAEKLESRTHLTFFKYSNEDMMTWSAAFSLMGSLHWGQWRHFASLNASCGWGGGRGCKMAGANIYRASDQTHLFLTHTVLRCVNGLLGWWMPNRFHSILTAPAPLLTDWSRGKGGCRGRWQESKTILGAL